LTTTRRLTDEYFAALQYYSEIEEVGLDFIKRLGYEDLSKQKRIFLLFQSFVRQGKSFFDAAEKLDYRTSPLLYYYSFLNLTKAYISLCTPDVVDKKIRHGLTHKHTITEFESQIVQIDSVGVFQIFYEKLLGAQIKAGLELNISRLLGYIPDISYEYRKVKYGPLKFVVGSSRVAANVSTKKAWPLLAIATLEQMKDFNSCFNSFYEYFEEVSLPNMNTREVFNIAAEDSKFYNFLQSKIEYDFTSENNPPRRKIVEDCLLVLQDYCKPLSVKADMDFCIFLPLNEEQQVLFNDTLSIYVVMFYLGSLVRYFPSYLEGLLNSKHAWIIEGFTQQVGVVFLRNICSLIIKENLVYTTL